MKGFTTTPISEYPPRYFWRNAQPVLQQCAAYGNGRKTDQTIIDTSRKFKCPKCDKFFSQSYSMYRHYRYECDTMPRYQCPYCSHLSKWTHSIYNHIRKLHPGLEVTVNRLY